MAIVKTIKIIDKRLPSGFRIINESDFDSKIHKKSPTRKKEQNAGSKIT